MRAHSSSPHGRHSGLSEVQGRSPHFVVAVFSRQQYSRMIPWQTPLSQPLVSQLPTGGPSRRACGSAPVRPGRRKRVSPPRYPSISRAAHYQRIYADPPPTLRPTVQSILRDTSRNSSSAVAKPRAAPRRHGIAIRDALALWTPRTRSRHTAALASPPAGTRRRRRRSRRLLPAPRLSLAVAATPSASSASPRFDVAG